MPCELSVYPELRAFHSKYYGEVTLADILSQRELIAARPDLCPDYSLIVDLSGATRLGMGYGEVYALAKSGSPLKRFARHIFVAPSDVAYGIARMYQTLALDVHRNTVVVRTMEEAIAVASANTQAENSPGAD